MISERWSFAAFVDAPDPAQLAGELAALIARRLPALVGDEEVDYGALAAVAQQVVSELQAVGHDLDFRDEDGSTWIYYQDQWDRPNVHLSLRLTTEPDEETGERVWVAWKP
ncbi:MAG: hypothetical protein KF782_12565 [Labilithrix sp.]|nr:hypothetical protein [Labilithrix sp.]